MLHFHPCVNERGWVNMKNIMKCFLSTQIGDSNWLKRHYKCSYPSNLPKDIGIILVKKKQKQDKIWPNIIIVIIIIERPVLIKYISCLFILKWWVPNSLAQPLLIWNPSTSLHCHFPSLLSPVPSSPISPVSSVKPPWITSALYPLSKWPPPVSEALPILV